MAGYDSYAKMKSDAQSYGSTAGSYAPYVAMVNPALGGAMAGYNQAVQWMPLQNLQAAPEPQSLYLVRHNQVAAAPGYQQVYLI